VKFFLFLLIFWQSISAKELQYSPAPPDNPLKGLVPYASEWKRERFPHSMEFRYLPMDKLMTGWDQFDWSALEMELEGSKTRGKQSIFRIFLEYPGRDPAVPKFLVDEGVKITEWTVELGTAPSQIQLRIPNPMKGDLPLRFANKEQGKDWLTVDL
jgi:hypothetical protein